MNVVKPVRSCRVNDGLKPEQVSSQSMAQRATMNVSLIILRLKCLSVFCVAV